MNFVATWFLVFSVGRASTLQTDVIAMPNLLTCEAVRDQVLTAARQTAYNYYAICVEVRK